jgi:hypothetical protein
VLRQHVHLVLRIGAPNFHQFAWVSGGDKLLREVEEGFGICPHHFEHFQIHLARTVASDLKTLLGRRECPFGFCLALAYVFAMFAPCSAALPPCSYTLIKPPTKRRCVRFSSPKAALLEF